MDFIPPLIASYLTAPLVWRDGDDLTLRPDSTPLLYHSGKERPPYTTLNIYETACVTRWTMANQRGSIWIITTRTNSWDADVWCVCWKQQRHNTALIPAGAQTRGQVNTHSADCVFLFVVKRTWSFVQSGPAASAVQEQHLPECCALSCASVGSATKIFC